MLLLYVLLLPSCVLLLLPLTPAPNPTSQEAAALELLPLPPVLLGCDVSPPKLLLLPAKPEPAKPPAPPKPEAAGERGAAGLAPAAAAALAVPAASAAAASALPAFSATVSSRERTVLM
jgi:hypothetical protein